MNNKKKIIIGSCCGIVLVILSIAIVNFGHGTKYEKIARKLAERHLEQDVNEYGVKASKLKYLSTFYNKTSDLYRVSYYAKFNEVNEKGNMWVLEEIIISGETSKVEISYSNGYGPEFNESDVIADGHVKEKEVEDEDGIWTKVN